MSANELEPITADIDRLVAGRDFVAAAVRLTEFRSNLDRLLSNPETDARAVLSHAAEHTQGLLASVRVIRGEMQQQARSLVCLSRYLDVDPVPQCGTVHGELG